MEVVNKNFTKGSCKFMQIYGIPNFISMRFGFFALLLWLWRNKISKFRLKHTDIKKKIHLSHRCEGPEAIIQRLLLAALLCHPVCFCSEDVSIQSRSKRSVGGYMDSKSQQLIATEGQSLEFRSLSWRRGAGVLLTCPAAMMPAAPYCGSTEGAESILWCFKCTAVCVRESVQRNALVACKSLFHEFILVSDLQSCDLWSGGKLFLFSGATDKMDQMNECPLLLIVPCCFCCCLLFCLISVINTNTNWYWWRPVL